MTHPYRTAPTPPPVLTGSDGTQLAVGIVVALAGVHVVFVPPSTAPNGTAFACACALAGLAWLVRV